MKISKNYALNQINWNKPQWRSAVTVADIIIDVWSRGTGKTTSQGKKFHTLSHALPRGLIAVTGRTLDQMMVNTLPGAFGALDDWGITEWDGKRGDYVVGRKPPEDWPKPYDRRLKFDKCISFNTGTAFMLISQQTPNSGRGPSFDGVIGDEALTLKHDQLKQEVQAANRGNKHRFNSPLHHSEHYWTSKPYVGMGQWINDYASYYKEDYDMDIFKRNNEAANILLQFIDSRSRQEQEELWEWIAAFLQENPYKVSCQTSKSDPTVFYNEATVFENIQALGWGYIKRLRKSMTDFMFKVEVLNMSVNAAENKFYHVTEDLLYDPPSYFEQNGIELLNRGTVEPYMLDTDVARAEPLDFAFDANAGICTCAVGQLVGNDYNTLNGLFVKDKLISHLAQKVCKYYSKHSKKHARLFYDHTFNYTTAGMPKSFITMIAEAFRANGWTVELRYIGQQPGHHSRYESINQLIMGESRYHLGINRNRCTDLYTALESTGVRVSSNGEFKKDKRAEGDKNAKQEHTTHFTDAWDTLLLGRLIVHSSPISTTEDSFSGLNTFG